MVFPCSYVFDGKPPDLKSGELDKRKERRQEAEKELEKAKELGDSENVNKFERRLVRVTSQHNDECKDLLKLMGIPSVTVRLFFDLYIFDLLIYTL